MKYVTTQTCLQRLKIILLKELEFSNVIQIPKELDSPNFLKISIYCNLDTPTIIYGFSKIETDCSKIITFDYSLVYFLLNPLSI